MLESDKEDLEKRLHQRTRQNSSASYDQVSNWFSLARIDGGNKLARLPLAIFFRVNIIFNGKVVNLPLDTERESFKT